MKRAAIIALLAVLAGCKKEVKETNPPLCREQVAGSEAEEAADGQVPANVWFLILLGNFNPEAMLVTRPATDCTGRLVETQDPAPMCGVGEERTARLPDRPLTEEDLQITPTDDGRQLVWIRTTHFENGEALGPVGVTEWTKRGVDVRALGTLRAHKEKAAMHLEPLGAGNKVLVVESRVCEPDDPKDCWRLMRLLPMVDKKFVESPLLDQNGECLGPAVFRLYENKAIELPDGTARKFEISRSIDFSDGLAVVSESVTIKDRDPTQPDAPPTLFRKANLKRELEVTPEGLKTKTGLWETMLSKHGSVEVQTKAPPTEDAAATETPPTEATSEK